jgi:enoyl-CoA hydratase/carnithine racemase
MAYETIRVDVAENIQTITLHRPEKLNAFTRQMIRSSWMRLEQPMPTTACAR